MLEFLSANLATILVGVAVLAIVALIVYNMIRAHKKGGSSCGSACAGCPNAGICHAHAPKDRDLSSPYKP